MIIDNDQFPICEYDDEKCIIKQVGTYHAPNLHMLQKNPLM